jgi:hypothetical protein
MERLNSKQISQRCLTDLVFILGWEATATTSSTYSYPIREWQTTVSQPILVNADFITKFPAANSKQFSIFFSPQ